nr:hypothetical protein [Tanacetum cinerariifolium]
GQTNQTVHMITPSKDNLYNGRKGIGFENPSYFEKAKDLRPTLYDEKVIGLGYTPLFLTHFDEALEIEKFKRFRENKIEFAYDYGNLNASYVNEKKNFEDDYFQDIINPDFEKIDSPFQQTSSLKPYVPNSKGFESSENVSSELENQTENDCLVVEKEYDKEENPKVIAPGMFKLNVSQCVSPISMSKSLCDSNNVENLNTFSSVRRPKHSSIFWKKKGSSNTSNVGLSAASVSNLYKNVKRYSRKDLLAKMSRDVLIIGSTMRIPLLYWGEYSQWSERFMNYLEEKMNGKAMINSIKHDDQPLLHVTQVYIARTSSAEQPPLKDKSMWSDQEKKIQIIDHLARSLSIQGLPNDIYSLIDNNKTAKDL